MRVVRGAKGKNMFMAKLFIEEYGNLFIDYGKNAVFHSIYGLPNVYGHDFVSIDHLMELLEEFLPEIAGPKVYVDGYFCALDIVRLEKWANKHPNIGLTVSFQDNSQEEIVVEVV